MLILFPPDPRQPRSPESDYRAEWDACLALGFRAGVVDHDELIRGDVSRALRFLPPGSSSGLRLFPRPPMLRQPVDVHPSIAI